MRMALAATEITKRKTRDRFKIISQSLCHLIECRFSDMSHRVEQHFEWSPCLYDSLIAIERTAQKRERE